MTDEDIDSNLLSLILANLFARDIERVLIRALGMGGTMTQRLHKAYHEILLQVEER